MQASPLFTYGLPIGLFVVMLGLGLSLTLDDFRRVLVYPRAALVGLSCQMLVLPLLCFGLVKAFALPPELAVGMMLLAASPGGAVANLFSHLARGDVALNVTLTATNSVLSLMTLPFVVNLSLAHFLGADRSVPLPIAKVLQVVGLVLVPVSIGMVVRARRPALTQRMERPVRALSGALIAGIVLASIFQERGNVLDFFKKIGPAALAFNLLSMGVGYFVPRLARLPERQAVAIAMEIGIHNAALAITLATSPFLLDSPTMAIPAGVYSLISFGTAAIFTRRMARRLAPAAGAGLVALAPAAPALAASRAAPVEEPEGPPPIPARRVVLNSLLPARFNPLGLEEQLRLGLQLRLYESASKAFRDNFVHFGVYPRISPAQMKFGPSFEIQPASFLNVRVVAEYYQAFGTFGFLQSFPSPAAEHSDTARDANEEAGLHYVTGGWHVAIEPLVQLQVGPIAVRNRVALERFAIDVRRGDRVFYDGTLDTLAPTDGWTVADDVDLLFLIDRGWRLALGARYSFVIPLYGDRDFPTAADRAAFEANGALRGNAHHRLGPVAAFTFYDDGYTLFNKPTVAVIAAWYLSHRYRTGQDVAGGVPYVVAAFAFQSDLL